MVVVGGVVVVVVVGGGVVGGGGGAEGSAEELTTLMSLIGVGMMVATLERRKAENHLELSRIWRQTWRGASD